MGERTLVCILAQTRAHEATWIHFKKNVLDALGADLALCIGMHERYDTSNPFWQHARYRWTAPELEDFSEGFDEARAWYVDRGGIWDAADWRSLIAIKGNWLGGICGLPGSGAIQLYFRWVLQRRLIEEDVLPLYDRFILTRSDFIWPVPHPPLAVLAPEFLWMPDGERYGGLPDRHVVASRADMLSTVNLLEDIVLRSGELAQSMRGAGHWNSEKFLKHHLLRQGFANRLRFFPYVMYAVRGPTDTSRWAMGLFDKDLGLYVKYETERLSARRYRRIRSGEDWRKLAARRPKAFHGDWNRPPPRRTLRSLAGGAYRRVIRKIAKLIGE